MSHAPETPDEILHPKQPLWARNVEEDQYASTRREWHAIATDRGGMDEWHEFRTRCDRMLEGVMSSIRTQFNQPPDGEPTCAECLRAQPISPSGVGDTLAR